MKTKQEVIDRIAQVSAIHANNELVEQEIREYSDAVLEELKDLPANQLLHLAWKTELELSPERVKEFRGLTPEAAAAQIYEPIRQKLAELHAKIVDEDEYLLEGLQECLELFEAREDPAISAEIRANPEFVAGEEELFKNMVNEQIKHARRFIELFGSESKGRIDASSWVLEIEPNYEVLDDGVSCPEWEDQIDNLRREIEASQKKEN